MKNLMKEKEMNRLIVILTVMGTLSVFTISNETVGEGRNETFINQFQEEMIKAKSHSLQR